LPIKPQHILAFLFATIFLLGLGNEMMSKYSTDSNISFDLDHHNDDDNGTGSDPDEVENSKTIITHQNTTGFVTIGRDSQYPVQTVVFLRSIGIAHPTPPPEYKA
jgi:hypothetical protein